MTRKIIAILRGVRPDEVLSIGHALTDAGINRIEVPLNSPEPLKSIEILVDALGEDALIGAGTVLTPEDVAGVNSVGGKLIVSPDCNPDVIQTTKAAGLQSYPGVMTPTECFAAIRAGADGLKMFPGNLIGPEGMQAMLAVIPPTVDCYAVGGAGPSNFQAWCDAGARGFGIGSGIYKPGYDAAKVSELAKEIVKVFDATEKA